MKADKYLRIKFNGSRRSPVNNLKKCNTKVIMVDTIGEPRPFMTKIGFIWEPRNLWRYGYYKETNNRVKTAGRKKYRSTRFRIH